MLAGLGVALCFRGNVATWAPKARSRSAGSRLRWWRSSGAATLGAAVLPVAIVAGILGGAGWAVIAAAIHLTRGVHEVLVTLMMNFIALLVVAEFLHGPLGETGRRLSPDRRCSSASRGCRS